MNKIKFYIKSMRLRSLPLSFAGISLGLMLAATDYRISWLVVIFTFLTTGSLQVLSNISNELGDSLSGVDTADRKGPKYSLGVNGLTVQEMKRFIVVMTAACIIFGLLLIYFSYGTLFDLEPICLMLLGGAAIAGAIKYTLGRNPYGYRGLGDISVFTFFGIVSVLGSYFVAAHTIPSWIYILPAVAIGFFSVGVLNVNNIRDMKTDAGLRVTIPIRLGLFRSRLYHTFLIVGGLVCLLVFNMFRFQDPWHYAFFITLPLFGMHLYGVWTKTEKDLDPMLPQLVISTFLLSIIMGLGYLIPSLTVTPLPLN